MARAVYVRAYAGVEYRRGEMGVLLPCVGIVKIRPSISGSGWSVTRRVTSEGCFKRFLDHTRYKCLQPIEVGQPIYSITLFCRYNCDIPLSYQAEIKLGRQLHAQCLSPMPRLGKTARLA
jgi:hypothetical protein